MDNLVDTRTAAWIYGCSTQYWIRLAKQYGVLPVAREGTDRTGSGCHYFWNPEDVLQTRKQHRAVKIENQRVRLAKVKSPSTRILSRHAMLERERNKRLAKVAAVKGIDVKTLRVALGIDKA